VTKDNADKYSIIDDRTGLKYQLVIGNGCDRTWEKKYKEWLSKDDAYTAYADWVKNGRKPPPVKPAPKPPPKPPEIDPNAMDVTGVINPGDDGKTPTIVCTTQVPAK
jgi:hypothetical protein